MFFYFHSGLMAAAFVLLGSGVWIARSMRHRRWWLGAHRLLGAAGAGAALLGFAMAVLMVAESGDPHFNVLHAWNGLLIAAFAAAVPFIGQLQFVMKARRMALRAAHRATGALLFVLLCFNLLSGLSLAGVIPS